MDRTKFAEHAKVTAICVEFALSAVEADIQREIDKSTGPTAEVLLRLINKVGERKSNIVDVLPVAMNS